jgi:hypothetical protein
MFKVVCALNSEGCWGLAAVLSSGWGGHGRSPYLLHSDSLWPQLPAPLTEAFSPGLFQPPSLLLDNKSVSQSDCNPGPTWLFLCFTLHSYPGVPEM